MELEPSELADGRLTQQLCFTLSAALGECFLPTMCDAVHTPRVTSRPYLHPLATLCPGRVIMGNGVWRDFPSHPREFDGWCRANAILGSVLAVGILVMALAGLFSAGLPDGATEFSSVTAPK
jgi:hypothetical protein